MNRTTIGSNIKSSLDCNINNLQSSQNALKELKKKWNQVSSRPKANLNHSSFNDTNSNYLNESMNSRNSSSMQGELKIRKSIKK
jgi:hypothetical protein